MYFLPIGLPILGILYKWNPPSLLLCDWLVSLRLMFSRFIHVVASITTSFPFDDHIIFCDDVGRLDLVGLFIHPWAFGWFPFLPAVINHAGMNNPGLVPAWK